MIFWDKSSDGISKDISGNETERIFYCNDKYKNEKEGKRGMIKAVFLITLSIITGLFIGKLT